MAGMPLTGKMILLCVVLALAVSSVFAGLSQRVSISPSLPGAASIEPAPGVFLVAQRSLDGSHFERTVIYLVEHDEQGTLGLIVNRASKIDISEAIPDIETGEGSGHRLHYGGPVGLSAILILSRGDSAIEGMTHVAEDVYVGSDRLALDALLAEKRSAGEVRFYIGYSGWGPGQLDSELERDSWHVVAAGAKSIFSDDGASLWNRLIESLEPVGIQVRGNSTAPGLKKSVRYAQRTRYRHV